MGFRVFSTFSGCFVSSKDQVYASNAAYNIYFSIQRERTMNRNSEARDGKARKVFRRRKILTLGEVAELIHSSIHTARRRIKEWRAHTSYNQNGRYYTLPEVPEFDAEGLWRCRGVFFSRHGNLKQSVVELIARSQAGLDAGELGSLLGARSPFVPFRLCR